MISTDILNARVGQVFLGLLLTGVVTVVGLFTFSYVAYSHSGLPIGWDTPRYIGQTYMIEREGVLSFIQENDYYNFGYAILLSVLNLAGLSPFISEIFVPIALCVSLIIITGILPEKFLSDRKIVFYTMLLASSWFAIYRLGADLHPNLLAFVILLISSYFYLTSFDKPTKLYRALFFALLTVASFIHIETTMFFAFIFIISSLFIYWRVKVHVHYSLRRLVVDVFFISLLILPSIILYFIHLNRLLGHQGGLLILFRPLSIYEWIGYIGILIPVAMLGLYSIVADSFGKRCCPYNVLLSTWALTSIAIGLVHYVIPRFLIFSERALILFPAPYITSVGLERFSRYRVYQSGQSNRFLSTKQLTAIFCVVLFILPLISTYYFIIPSQRVWISPSAFNKLCWLSGNYSIEEDPIFIFNDYDKGAGTLGNMYNDWVQASYGDHFSYLGDIGFLLASIETPYTSEISRTISSIFLEKLHRNDILRKPNLLQHKIIVITDFYLPKPIPVYNRVFLDEIYEGIYVVNYTRTTQPQQILVPIHSRITTQSSMEGWYATENSWADSSFTLEFWAEHPSNPRECEILITVPMSETYRLTLRYWDGEGVSDMIVQLDDSTLGTISYTGRQEPTNFTALAPLNSGFHTLRITLEYNPQLPQYASLDYLEISLEE